MLNQTPKLLGVSLFTLLLMGGGCIPSPERVAEEAMEKAINNQLGDQGSVDLSGDGSVTWTDNETGATGSFGADVDLPNDFPSDVPVLDEAKISGVAVNADGAWVALSTEMSIAKVVEWYEAKLTEQGWTKSGTYSAAGTTTVTFEKDNVVVAVMAAASETDSMTVVTVTRSEK